MNKYKFTGPTLGEHSEFLKTKLRNQHTRGADFEKFLGEPEHMLPLYLYIHMCVVDKKIYIIYVYLYMYIYNVHMMNNDLYMYMKNDLYMLLK